MKQKTIDVPLYKGKLSVMFTEDCKDVVKYMTDNEDLENAVYAEKHDPFGTTYQTNLKDIRCTLIVLNPKCNEWRPSVISHESCHAAECILDNAGHNEGGEPLAYLVDFIADFIFDFAKESDVKVCD